MKYGSAVSEETPASTTTPIAVDGQIDAASPAETGERSISLGERLRSPQTIVSFLIAFAVVFFVFRQLNIDFGEVWTQVRNADPKFLALAFVAYYSSFPIRALRWRLILRNAGISSDDGHAMPGVWGLSEIYLLSWFANCVVPAKLGDAYRGYLLKKNAGPSFSRTLGTILAERLLDVVALVALMFGAGLLVFHGTVPASMRWWFGAGAALVVLGIGGLILVMTISHRIQHLFPERFRPHFLRLTEGIIMSFSRRGFVRVSLLTFSIWTLEGLRVYSIALALDVDISFPASVFVALLASLLTTIPITPAGLGFVEGGTVVALKLLGVGVTSATAMALIDRAIANYSVVVIGGILYLFSKRK
jgi:uncharacterized protein (TIRG00374 family)